MARAVTSRNRKLVVTVVAWVVGLLIFFPILWTIITSFKTEGEAIHCRPSSCSPPGPRKLPRRPGALELLQPCMNSVMLSVGSTLLALHHRHSRRLGDGLLAHASAPRIC